MLRALAGFGSVFAARINRSWAVTAMVERGRRRDRAQKKALHRSQRPRRRAGRLAHFIAELALLVGDTAATGASDYTTAGRPARPTVNRAKRDIASPNPRSFYRIRVLAAAGKGELRRRRAGRGTVPFRARCCCKIGPM
jgi:hypothetical protein